MPGERSEQHHFFGSPHSGSAQLILIFFQGVIKMFIQAQEIKMPEERSEQHHFFGSPPFGVSAANPYFFSRRYELVHTSAGNKNPRGAKRA
ncbi:MAG: hypothetical protein ABIT96_10155, partial [Ferruginibacter sp.]